MRDSPQFDADSPDTVESDESIQRQWNRFAVSDDELRDPARRSANATPPMPVIDASEDLGTAKASDVDVDVFE